MRAINDEIEVFSFYKGDSLCNKTKKYFGEGIFRDSFSEVMKSIVVESFLDL